MNGGLANLILSLDLLGFAFGSLYKKSEKTNKRSPKLEITFDRWRIYLLCVH
jgi:hypothetical protein